MENLVDENKDEVAETQRFGTLKRIGMLSFRLAVCGLSLVDFWTDFLLGFQYAGRGEAVYATFTFLFTLVPTAFGALYVVRYLRRKV